MIIYYTKSSPYAACVRSTCVALNIAANIDWRESQPFDNQEALLESNPLGKVPCLVVDGEAIYDSEVICDYLDATTCGGLLFEKIYGDWRLKTFYSLCNGLIDISVNRRIEVLRDQEKIKSDFWWERYNNALERSLAEANKKLTLLPDDLSIIHITLFNALAYLDFRHPDVKWREAHENLKIFHEQLKTQDCFKDISYS